MTAEELSRYVIGPNTEVIPDDADLDAHDYRDAHGDRVTEASTREYTEERARRAGGRPSLHGGRGSTPTIAIRMPADLRDRLAEVAAAEGRSASAVARDAVEAYIAEHV